MNSYKDSFTDLTQLGKLNQKIFRIYARRPQISAHMKPEVVATASPSESTVIGDPAELIRRKLILPMASSYNAFPTEGEKT